ncbi:Far-red impaired responsive family protein, partial [Prunus dulcis]
QNNVRINPPTETVADFASASESSTTCISQSLNIMDHQSVHGFDSDESDLDMHAETYENNEGMEDVLSENLDLCLDEKEGIAEPSADLPMNIEALEPNIGMEFNSRDEAREFYVAYGRQSGFTVRIHHNRRSRVNNQVIGQDFVCSKEGFRAKKYVHRKDRVLPPPPVTREGCQAMIRLALRDGLKWDEKDKRIRELSLELYNERQKCKRRCAAYEEQLNLILKDLEKHTEHMSKKVADIVQSIREIEEEQSEDSDSGWT